MQNCMLGDTLLGVSLCELLDGCTNTLIVITCVYGQGTLVAQTTDTSYTWQ